MCSYYKVLPRMAVQFFSKYPEFLLQLKPESAACWLQWESLINRSKCTHTEETHVHMESSPQHCDMKALWSPAVLSFTVTCMGSGNVFVCIKAHLIWHICSSWGVWKVVSRSPIVWPPQHWSVSFYPCYNIFSYPRLIWRDFVSVCKTLICWFEHHVQPNTTKI